MSLPQQVVDSSKKAPSFTSMSHRLGEVDKLRLISKAHTPQNTRFYKRIHFLHTIFSKFLSIKYSSNLPIGSEWLFNSIGNSREK